MKKNNFLLPLSAALLSLALLTGCSPRTGDSGGDETQSSTTALAQTQATVEKEEPVVVRGEFVLEPSVEAEKIYYYQTTQPCDFAVIETETGVGLIDYSGNLILPPTQYYIDPSQTVLGGTEVRLRAVDSDGNEYWVRTDGSLENAYVNGWGGSQGAQIWWDEEKNEPVLFIFSGSAWKSYFSYQTYNANVKPYFHLGVLVPEAPTVMAVKSITGYEIDESGRPSVENESDRYGLLDLVTGEMLTDFIFEKAGSLGTINGVIALKKDGKWGYYNEAGEQLTDFVYDDSGENVSEEMLPALNGYVIVTSGGCKGLIDTAGNTVLSPVFEDLSQVNPNGMLWVKQDGKWGVMQLDGFAVNA